MTNETHDINEIKRRMQGASAVLKTELSGLRTGRASAHLLDPVMVDAYGAQMPLNQVASVTIPEPRLIAVNVWDRSLVHAVEKAIVNSNLGLSPATEGQMHPAAHPGAQRGAAQGTGQARAQIRRNRARGRAPCAPRRHGRDQEAGKGSQDQQGRSRSLFRRYPEGDRCRHREIDHMLAGKEKEILTV